MVGSTPASGVCIHPGCECTVVLFPNKDLQIIWKFTYRILNFERRVKVVNKEVDTLLVSWIDMK